MPQNNEPDKTKSRRDSLPNKTITVTLPKLPKINLKNYISRTQAFFLIAVLIVGVGGGFLGGWIESKNYKGQVLTATTNGSQKIVLSSTQLDSEIAKNISPSVVSITANTTSQSSGFFGFTQPIQTVSEGTGIIISSNGLVLTNRHVVPAGTTSVSITLSNGTQLNNVSVVGRTSTSDTLDIAILKINNSDGVKLIPAVLGNSSQVQVGDAVIAVGNALGQFQNTVTSGIISGFGRNITAGSSGGNNNIFGLTSSSSENLTDMFQTDAAINEGNSGGPLVNLNGQVIGINTAIASNSQNIGFAIPINEVEGLIKEVLTTGKFRRPFLGVRFELLNPTLASKYHLSVSAGAYIPQNTSAGPSIIPGSAAAKAGLKPGDVITKVNNVNVNMQNDLTLLIDQYMPGTKVKLTVVSGSHTKTIIAKLGGIST
ncbi:trypsin-like peptidase domain-containing protein [Patescibacteria group bacterium]|nr:trypsin-like peptidase domain-containing protein [Patescibacteria group bacterium]